VAPATSAALSSPVTRRVNKKCRISANGETCEHDRVHRRNRSEGEGHWQRQDALAEADRLPEEIDAVRVEEQRGKKRVLQRCDGIRSPPQVPDSLIGIGTAITADDAACQVERQRPGEDYAEEGVDRHGDQVETYAGH